MTRTRLVTAVALLALSAPFAWAALPQDPPAKPDRQALMQRVNEFYGTYQKLPQIEGQPTPEQLAEMRAMLADAAAKGLEGIDATALDAESRRILAPMLTMSPKHREAIVAMLAKESAKPDADGFAAAVERLEYVDPAPEGAGAGTATILVAALDHPGAEAGIRANGGGSLAYALRQLPEDQLKAKSDRLATLLKAFDANATDQAMRASATFLKASRAALEPARFEEIRSSLAAEVDRRAATAPADAKKDLTRLAKTLNGAAMRGQLLDHACPDLTMLWLRPGEGESTFASMADLKGKVVVLDFWATWCGPCVASFPEVKQLRADYSPNELAIIGVTSPQGRVYHKGKAMVDCGGDIEKEKAEMAQYAQDMGVTWTMAMTEQDVFNPDFGVEGIPFVAILDKDGKVVKAGLHPMNKDEIRATIDRLLGKSSAAAPTGN
jgi:thiol-disulfide isomerase/thioredoxin